jgi:hypothetical protein
MEDGMRVRIRKCPRSGGWYVDGKKWYEFRWSPLELFLCDEAKERALKYAKGYLNPEIIEVKAQEPKP